MQKFDIAVIGAGPSGIYASTYAALKKLNVLVIEFSDAIGGQPRHLYGHKMVYDFPAHLEISGEEIVQNLLAQQKGIENHIKYVLKTSVVEWKYDENKHILLHLSNGEQALVKALIIATGCGSLIPNELEKELVDEDVDKDSIAYHVSEFANYKDKDIVILGGGDSAVEWAGQIAASPQFKPKSVTIIHRRPTYRANAKYVEYLNEYDVHQYLDYEIKKIKKDCIKIISNLDQSEVEIKYDKIIVQYGLKQHKNLNKEWAGCQFKGLKFITDKNQLTSQENIYAIGFATHYEGRPNLMITGMAEAVVAVKHINDKINPYAADYISSNQN